jgi:hypothetical protein
MFISEQKQEERGNESQSIENIIDFKQKLSSQNITPNSENQPETPRDLPSRSKKNVQILKIKDSKSKKPPKPKKHTKKSLPKGKRF